MSIKKLFDLLFGKKKKERANAEPRQRDRRSYVCRSCGGTGIVKNFGGKKQIQCTRCMAIIHVGDYRLEVKGDNHEEVESVSLRLIEEISNRIKVNDTIDKDENLDKLEDLSTYLKNGKINKTIEMLIKFCESNGFSDFVEEAVGLSSRFSDLKKSQRLGTIGYDEFIINQNKIVNSITEILSLINKKMKN